MNKIERLQYKANKYGDYYVSHNIELENGDIAWAKHRSILDCEELDDTSPLFLAGHRTPYTAEVVLDYDELIEDIPLTSIIKRLCKESSVRSFKVYYTGNRGVHIHCIMPMLALYENRFVREGIRARFIARYDAEGLKASEKCMIMLEGSEHRKTGRTKIRLKV